MKLLKRIAVLRALRVGAGAAGLAGAALIASLAFHPDTDFQTSGLLKWGNHPRWAEATEADFEALAEFDYFAVSAGGWSSASQKAAADSLRKRNVDIRLGTYFPVMALGEWHLKAPDSPWNRDYIDAVAPYLARTTEGDTAAIFAANYTLNITVPACRTAIIEFFTAPERLGACDWFFMDFFSVPMPDLKIWQGPAYQEQEHGDLDLDGDGVGHWDDLDEQALLRESFFAFVRELREAAPKDTIPGKFKLIANGWLAVKDPAFGALLDGVFLEGVPAYGYGGEGFRNALSPEWTNGLPSLVSRDWNGGPGMIMLDCQTGARQMAGVAALWDNAADVQRGHGDAFPLFGAGPSYSTDLEFLGKPLGPPTATGEIIWLREYEGGALIVNTTSRPLLLDIETVGEGEGR